jgi:hypothetical protein
VERPPPSRCGQSESEREREREREREGERGRRKRRVRREGAPQCQNPASDEKQETSKDINPSAGDIVLSQQYAFKELLV